MSSGIVLLIVVVVLLTIVAYLVGVFVRRKNDGRLAKLDDQKEKLMSLPISDEIEAVNHLQLIGQSQEEFQSWKDKWTVLTTVTFKQLEEAIEQTEVYNDTFHFLKVNKSIERIQQELTTTEQELDAIRQGLSVLKEKKRKTVLE